MAGAADVSFIVKVVSLHLMSLLFVFLRLLRLFLFESLQFPRVFLFVFLRFLRDQRIPSRVRSILVIQEHLIHFLFLNVYGLLFSFYTSQILDIAEL